MVNEKTRAQNLHTLARRYCLDRLDTLPEFYATMQRQSHRGDAENTHRTFPLYAVVGIILAAVESVDAEKVGSVIAMRDALVNAAANVKGITASNHYRIEERAMVEERGRFINYIQTLTPRELDDVPTLYYSRRLNQGEVDRFCRLFKERWHTEFAGWYPLEEKPEGIDVEAFHVTIFLREVGYERLREMLISHGLSRVFEMHETGRSGYELDISDADPSYGAYQGLEVWWTDGDANFVIYASHESSITFAGWILDEVRRVWPEWQSNIYTGWDQA